MTTMLELTEQQAAEGLARQLMIGEGTDPDDPGNADLLAEHTASILGGLFLEVPWLMPALAELRDEAYVLGRHHMAGIMGDRIRGEMRGLEEGAAVDVADDAKYSGLWRAAEMTDEAGAAEAARRPLPQ